MNFKDRFNTILFDMDGVILDSMVMYTEAWTRACQELGLEMLDEQEAYRREGEKEEVSARDIIKRSGLMVTRARVRELVELKDRILRQIYQPKLFPGAIEVVQAFNQAGFQVGIVTGSSRDFFENMIPDEIKSMLAVSVCGDEVMRGKPNPEPYLTAIMKANAKANETIVVENAPFGIQSAKTAGAFVAGVRSVLPDQHLSEADFLVDDIRDLIQYI